MNKIYYQTLSREEKDHFYNVLANIENNCKKSVFKMCGEYDYHYYIMDKGVVYLYIENVDYGIPTSIEEITTMDGINVNCDQYDFCNWIALGLKTIETRNKPTLRKFVGKRVAIVSTRPAHKEKAVVIGYATIKKEIVYKDSVEFYCDSRHLINETMSKYRFNGLKYGYLLTDFTPVNGDKMIYTNGIISRKVDME